MENAAHGWNGRTRLIGVPNFAASDLLGCFVVVKHPHQRMLLHFARGRARAADVIVQISKMLSELDQVRGGNALVAKEQHKIFPDRIVQLLDLKAAERLRQVDVADLCADVR
jgi:hypothetical protein